MICTQWKDSPNTRGNEKPRTTAGLSGPHSDGDEEKSLTAERKTECESEVKMMSFIAVVLQTSRTMPFKV